MQILTAIGAFLQCVLYILTWRATAAQADVETKKSLEVKADEALRSGDSAKWISAWDAIRLYKR